MGRRQKKTFAQIRRDRKQGKTNANKPDRRAEPYQEIIRNNDAFIKYYKQMAVCPESEWDNFLDSIKADLPATFRITGCRSAAKKLLSIIQSEFFNDYMANREQEANDEHTVVKKPFCLPWYPSELGWQLELTRRDIRRSEGYYKLHSFLIAETTAGSISRQEAVSMIPPLVLDVQPHHKVLDMCAAPGSKTAQLIEALHADENIPIPSGFVVANDVDNNRCYMLVHQAKRLNSPCFVVTNHDSSFMPAFHIDGKRMKFDRVLCDVPCSGDGTLRKNPDIWLKWNQGHALNLHGIQYRIARRGAELLDVGGRLVYSTCSLNPIENEAVLHRLIKDAEGALELTDVSASLPGLKFAPGISHWEVAAKDVSEFYRSFDQVPESMHTIIRPQMFPPSKEEAASFHLERCIRLLPHFQNTGGFFVSVLTKTKLMPWERREKDEDEAKEAKTENSETATNADGEKVEEKSVPWGPQRKKQRLYGYKEDPYVFFSEDEPVWKSIKEFYQIDCDKLSTFKPTCLLTRCAVGKKKNIYFCSQSVKDLVQNNESNIKIINTGVKVFARCDNRNMRCEFRLANEGMSSISDVIGENRRITVSKEDLVVMLNHTDPTNPPGLELLCEDTRKRVENVGAGSCLLIYKDESGFTLSTVGWRGTRHLRAYVDLNDSIHMLRMLGADVSKYDVNKFNKKKERANENDNSEQTETLNEDDKDDEDEENIDNDAEGTNQDEEGEKDIEME